MRHEAWGLTSALLGAALLSGCAAFAPRYDPLLGDKAASAYERVAHFAADAELGIYADKASFAATAPDYADAQAQLAVARMRAAALPLSGTRAETARGQLVTLLTGCGARIASFAKQHKAFGIQPDSGASDSMMTSCDQAARAAQAMKGGAR